MTDIYFSSSGALIGVSHAVPCIEALNLNESMTLWIIYSWVANVVVCRVSAIFTPVYVLWILQATM